MFIFFLVTKFMIIFLTPWFFACFKKISLKSLYINFMFIY